MHNLMTELEHTESFSCYNIMAGNICLYMCPEEFHLLIPFFSFFPCIIELVFSEETVPEASD